ncbi:IclR family transcriptional regulator [Bosea sp. (in: a-proteobacteria)]|uniref:IclR family transcriptional regulator n=1 Tax=Bosea sp. (in: a-proteobacteria) TaxID=1871050 RepID=UPI002636CE5F|nr:IclR family transcriptional regulator C-terminal domain-containing protein [Bosea sp. (in: a-proteobacteria)]MCO5091270.1 helix-turn-helix domain-containing protein [Bosea sp. (in: a-proteobacteria)]
MQSIEVGGRLLSVLSLASQPLMLKDLATMADMPAGQAHAYLVSFRKFELVEQDASGLYRLGPFALQLGVARMRSFTPLQVACASIGDLANRLGLMVTIAVWGTHGPTIVQVNEGVEQIHVNLRPGTVYSISGTATGRVFAAYLPDELILPRATKEIKGKSQSQIPAGKPMDMNAFKQEIGRIRELGYGITENLPVPGVSAIAAPVFDHTGQLQLVVTLVGDSKKLKVTEKIWEADKLLEFTNRLTVQNGFVLPTPASEPASAPKKRTSTRGKTGGTVSKIPLRQGGAQRRQHV